MDFNYKDFIEKEVIPKFSEVGKLHRWIKTLEVYPDSQLEIIETSGGQFAVYFSDYINEDSDIEQIMRKLKSLKIKPIRPVFLKQSTNKYVYLSSKKIPSHYYEKYLDDRYVVIKIA